MKGEVIGGMPCQWKDSQAEGRKEGGEEEGGKRKGKEISEIKRYHTQN